MTARRTSRGSGRGRAAAKYFWDGIQWPATAAPATPGLDLHALGAQVQLHDGPATLQRIRGVVWNHHAGSVADTSASVLAQKIMYVELNDAGAMTGDWQGHDTDAEDVTRRQLWTRMTRGQVAAAGAETTNVVVHIDIDIKVKIRIETSAKGMLVLLTESDAAANHWLHGGYLRALYRVG